MNNINQHLLSNFLYVLEFASKVCIPHHTSGGTADAAAVAAKSAGAL